MEYEYGFVELSLRMNYIFFHYAEGNNTSFQDIVGKMESHLREQTRLSNAAQDRLIADEARFRSSKVG